MRVEQLEQRQQTVINRKGHELNVVDVGRKSAPTVVMVHGFASAWQGWASQIEFLRKNGFRVVAFDVPGHGLSPPHEKNTIFDYTEDVQDILGHLGIKKPVHLVAHSYGGPVALNFAQTNPQQTKSLTLISTFERHPTILKWLGKAAVWMRPGDQKKAKTMTLSERQALQDEFLGTGTITTVDRGKADSDVDLTPEPYTEIPTDKTSQHRVDRIVKYIQENMVYRNPELAKQEMARIPEATPEGLIRYFNAASNFQLDDKIAVPALIIHSRHDRIIPYWRGFDLRFRFDPKARSVRISGTSHVPHRENAEKVNAEILAHLKAHTR